MSGLIYDVVSSVLRRAGVRPSSSRVESESGADCVAVRVGTTREVCRALMLFSLPRSALCPRSWSCRHCRLYFYNASPPASSRCCTVQQYLTFIKTATSDGRGGLPLSVVLHCPRRVEGSTHACVCRLVAVVGFKAHTLFPSRRRITARSSWCRHDDAITLYSKGQRVHKDRLW